MVEEGFLSMPAWRDDKILELANQLTYSPAEKRREQLRAAIDLVPTIDGEKTYPWDFIYFRITGIQPRGHVDYALAGKVLRADLASLIEFLSDTLSIRIEDAVAAAAASEPADGIVEFEDLSRKFNVSAKTIQRWRKQGLFALKYVYPDGRRRLGFLESVVASFAAANREKVDRSAAFSQLSEEEKMAIVALARKLAAESRASIKEIARTIGRTMNRAPETIRYTLRRYDSDHPEAAIFQAAEGEIRRAAPAMAEGPAVENPAGPEAAPEGARPAEIAFVANPLFEHPEAENIILQVLPAEALARAQASVAAGANAKAGDVYMARMPRDLPPFLQEIFRQPVMPQELETDAFRRMNFLKYKADQLQKGGGESAAVQSLVAQAAELKNQILKSNLRVAVHVARKHQRAGIGLMELVSDATIWLMRAIDTYDFARGTSTSTISGSAPAHAKFSTYASFALMKNFARDRAEQLTRRDTRLLTGQQEILSALGDRAPADAPAEEIDAAMLQSDLLAVVEQLPVRERELLMRHYGLSQQAPLSLAQLGDQMGITKARVRQLKTRALLRLRGLLETRRDKLQKAAQFK